MSKTMRRILTVIPAVIIQALWILALMKWLAPWAAAINFALSLLALLFVLYIITKQDESTYKILWLLVILSFPLVGALLYLCFGNKRTTKPLKRKLAAAGSLPPLPEDEGLDEISAADPRMGQTFRWLSGVTGFPAVRARGVEYYPLGDALLPAMLAELEKAERFVFVEYFIVENGLMWDSMVEVLSRKAAQGVDVRVMYDDMGSLSTYSRKNADELRGKGIRCAAFNPLVALKGTLNYRDHRKMLIIDGRVAFSGGVNLADEYINKIEKHGHWKDIGFRVEGEAARCYARMFAEFWNAFSGDPIPEGHIPPVGGETGAGDGFVLSYYDSPLREQAASNELFVDLLSQAKERAWFYTPYLMPGEALQSAFVRAARRGVDVRIIMPGVPDKKLVFRMSRSFYPALLEAGVKIYEYTPGFVHAKACLIDGSVCSVGTVNLDYRSLFLHFENNSLFYGSSIMKALEADFLATEEKCEEKTVENIGGGFVKWLLDGVLRIFTPLC